MNLGIRDAYHTRRHEVLDSRSRYIPWFSGAHLVCGRNVGILNSKDIPKLNLVVRWAQGLSRPFNNCKS